MRSARRRGPTGDRQDAHADGYLSRKLHGDKISCFCELFGKEFLFYQYKREEFMARSHKRSNVASTFSAIKRKFGDHIRSRTPAAMVNEALSKLVCPDLTYVIMSQCELVIEAEFWPEKPQAEVPAILKMRRPV